MTPDYIELRKDMTTKEALAHIKEVGMDSETIYTAYVLSGGRKLIGIVSLRSLVIAPDHEKVSELMHEDIILAHVDDDQEEVSDLFKRYGFLALPVVDNEGRLVGIITVDDILDVIEEEMTEDIERMGGVIDSTDKEYLDMPVMDHVKAELPWLLLLMCSYFITGGLIARFEDALSSVVALVVYMPMLMGTGGNSGTQTTTLVVRGMSTGEIEMGDALKVFWKEFRVSIVIGICVSAVNFVRIICWNHNGTLDGADGVRLHAADRHHCQVRSAAASDGAKKNRHRPGIDVRTDDGIPDGYGIVGHVFHHGKIFPESIAMDNLLIHEYNKSMFAQARTGGSCE